MDPDNPIESDLARTPLAVPRPGTETDPASSPTRLVGAVAVVILRRQHEAQQPAPVLADREDGPILALAGIVLVRNPRPQDFARVGIAVKLRGVARRELAREVTGVAAATCRRAFDPRRCRLAARGGQHGR